ncbi:hypothetical protein M758_2G002100 [Ceratodon purpureus]|nr:hypothetical protein M758_2G002100 [Ceratodon purpureus]
MAESDRLAWPGTGIATHPERQAGRQAGRQAAPQVQVQVQVQAWEEEGWPLQGWMPWAMRVRTPEWCAPPVHQCTTQVPTQPATTADGLNNFLPAWVGGNNI